MVYKHENYVIIDTLQLAKKYHPDVNRNDPEAQKKFQAVSEAYEVCCVIYMFHLCQFFWIRNWSHIATHLVFLPVETTLFQKAYGARHFKSGRDKIWQDCSSIKCMSIEAAMTSFYKEKCCCLVSAHTVSTGTYATASAISWSIVHLYCLRG